MKLNKERIKDVLNYIIENQTFDLNEGVMSPIPLLDIAHHFANGNNDKQIEYSCAIVRCINEGFVISNYPRMVWSNAIIQDVTLRGFNWLESN